MSAYWEKLRDPRWQRKRLEVMERAGFRCEECGNEKETLNVHHLVYHKGHEPWEYENGELRCFCESCHEVWHEFKNLLLAIFIDFDFESIREFLGAGYAISMKNGATSFCRVGSEAARSGFGKILGLTEKEISRLSHEDSTFDASEIIDAVAKKNKAKKAKR